MKSTPVPPRPPALRWPLRSPRHAAVRVAGLAGVLGMLCGTPASADEGAEIGKLISAGQYPVAMAKVEAALQQHPRDPQLRFLKGVIFAEQNRTNDAIVIFTKLTTDFPDLAAPYNNLAVAYASSGQYERARIALEGAMRTSAVYGTAHDNLGDMYTKLSSQAYGKALQIDPGAPPGKARLVMLHSLSGMPAAPKPPVPAAAPAPAPVVAQVAAPVPRPAPPLVVAKAEPKPVPVKTAAPVEIKPEPKAAARPERKPEVAAETGHDEVLKVVDNWARAWSAKDVKAYLAAYASNFQTPKGESMQDWSQERRARIEGKGRIKVSVDAPQVSISGGTATVKFRQQYSSDRLNTASRKTLVLEKHGGQWQIKQERSGS